MEKRVIAIDPGFDRLGAAILEPGKNGMATLLHSECITTDKKDTPAERLLIIGLSVSKLIKKWGPDELAIESLFFNQNSSTALGVAEARGVVLYESAMAELKVFEYSPQAVKIAVTGYGKSDKKQVEMMVRKLVSMPESGRKVLDDELDAIAVGITHLATLKAI